MAQALHSMNCAQKKVSAGGGNIRHLRTDIEARRREKQKEEELLEEEEAAEGQQR